ncbi:hypothetical protein LPYR103PRE_13520 [Segatella asaccharophila]|jgi:hypothetical protein
MKVYYSPQYSGFTFTNLKGKGGILFDTSIVDTGGLIDLLCLHGVLHFETHDGTKRMIAYYKAMRRYSKDNPGHVLAQSFGTDGLDTAKICLSWRDALILAGWTAEKDVPSKRMAVLQGVEKYFDCPGTVDIIPLVIKAVNGGCTLPENLEIVTPCDYHLLQPVIVRLLDALKKQEVCLSTLKSAAQDREGNLHTVVRVLEGNAGKEVKLKKDDPSLRIVSFSERDDSLRWLSLQADNAFDVWIDGDSKPLDNYLRLEGKATTGSTVAQCMPQISQLFIIGLSLFSRPLNVNMLLEWLYAPMTPLGHQLAGRLASEIVNQGGYFNPECQKIIDNYLDGKYDRFKDGVTDEQRNDLIKRRRTAREKSIHIFLPSIKDHKGYTEADNKVDAKRLYEFSEALNTWARQQMTIINDDDHQSQLGKVKTETEAVMLLLDDYTDKRIPFATIENWMGSLYKYADYRQYSAQRGCRNVIASPGNIAGQTERTVWCDFMGYVSEKLTYSFLTPMEKRAFKKELSLWDESKELQYRRETLLLPLKMTSLQLTLVTYDRNEREPVEKHPLMIRLMQSIENLDVIIDHPQLDNSLYEDAKVIDNKNRNNDTDEFVHLPHPELVIFPDCESYSSLSNMFQSPVDYTFQFIADIYQSGLSAMAPMRTTKGNVAHAVIQTLFFNKDVEGSGCVPYIEKNLKDNYDRVFVETVDAYGSIMLLQENRIDTRTYKEQLRQCAERLLGIIKANSFHVTGIETSVKNKLGFAHDIDLLGYIDMYLANDDGMPFIFDFKWSDNHKWFDGLLRENKSLQLSLYRALVNSREEKKVGGVGYFLMPEGRMATTGGIAGDLVSTIALDEDRKGKDLMTEMRNSYAYRRNQIERGLIELGEGEGVGALQYGKDETEKDLVPLDTDEDGNKATCPFSIYECFKRK